MINFYDEHCDICGEVDDIETFQGYKIYGNPRWNAMWKDNNESTHESELIDVSFSINFLIYSN